MTRICGISQLAALLALILGAVAGTPAPASAQMPICDLGAHNPGALEQSVQLAHEQIFRDWSRTDVVPCDDQRRIAEAIDSYLESLPTEKRLWTGPHYWRDALVYFRNEGLSWSVQYHSRHALLGGGRWFRLDKENLQVNETLILQ